MQKVNRGGPILPSLIIGSQDFPHSKHLPDRSRATHRPTAHDTHLIRPTMSVPSQFYLRVVHGKGDDVNQDSRA